MSDQQDRILRLFIEEAKEHLDTLEKGLVDLSATMKDPENITEMFRAAHSVKGGAAMLNLDSIKTTAHRLEDCFKVLRDKPTTKVDQTAESLFLKGVDVLRDLFNRLEGTFGLSSKDADGIVQKILPVFTQLENHLNALASGKVPAATKTAAKTEAAPGGVANFANQVMAVLKVMLQGFKQPESPDSRKQLVAACAKLLTLGSDIQSWQGLVKGAQQAIANPKNSYKILAPLIIKELKDAGDLVQAGKFKEIAPSKNLQQLIGTVSKPPAKEGTAPQPAAPPAQKQITIPAEPKAAVKALLQNFDKKQLSEIAKLLVQAIKAAP
ncbi:histidine kinase [Oscillatoriales cyanobacterium USR001]|nr:histidine kinase [Oscillatoriales cyanobacterium USR001]